MAIQDFGKTFETPEDWKKFIADGVERYGDAFMKMRQMSNEADNKKNSESNCKIEDRYGNTFDFINSKAIEQSKDVFDHEMLWRDAIRDAEKAEETRLRRRWEQ